MRQQYMVATRGDIAQFRHREVRWEGLIIFSRQNNYCFLTKNRGFDRAISPLYEPGVHLRFEI
jgi:hypothetical protein